MVVPGAQSAGFECDVMFLARRPVAMLGRTARQAKMWKPLILLATNR